MADPWSSPSGHGALLSYLFNQGMFDLIIKVIIKSRFSKG